MELNNDHKINWILQEGRIVIALSESNIAEVKAIEVYEAEFKSINDKPSQLLKNLSFSKVPLLATLIINIIKDQTNIDISAEIKLKNLTGSIEFYVKRLESDHIINNNTWFPIISEDVEAIKEVFLECRIYNPESITLRSYLNLIKINQVKKNIEFRETASYKKIPKTLSALGLEGFNAKLYNYQMTGFKWLSKISNEDFGCILADEMGLGKTIQIVALVFSDQKSRKDPALVVCPASLLENWRREFKKFAPDIRTCIHNGTHRTGFPDILKLYDVIITSYDTAVRDLSLLEAIKWNFLICDEAQAIKNPLAKRTQYLKQINRRVSIAVTGTPFENRLTDIWSLIDLVANGLLGRIDSFRNDFPDSVQSAERLEPLISPIILRRLVNDVALDLPKRIDIPIPIQMDEKLAHYYDKFRNDIIEKYGDRATLVNLQLLRQFCCDPLLAFKNNINYDELNLKFQRLLEIITEIYKTGNKALIFTSFHDISDKILNAISYYLKCYVKAIDGRVEIPIRQEIIDEFSNVTGPAFLVLNPKAAGTGLNITAANHVIHYNLEWNPAVEDQANARAYRRGQTKPVFIYKLYYVQTVEEFLVDKSENKRELSKKSIIGIDGENESIKDILNALHYSPLKE